jgi:hypothetical protein
MKERRECGKEWYKQGSIQDKTFDQINEVFHKCVRPYNHKGYCRCICGVWNGLLKTKEKK